MPSPAPARLLGCAAAALLALTACGGAEGTPVVDASGIDGVLAYSDLSRDHVEGDLDYDPSPPVGGAHADAWLTCNGTVYDEPVRDENAVHSLEHGAVWVTYQPDLAAAEVATLVDVVEAADYTFLSPYPGLASPVVLSAWGLQLAVDAADDPRVQEFVDTYAGGPQTPEPGAPCDGGVESGDDHTD